MTFGRCIFDRQQSSGRPACLMCASCLPCNRRSCLRIVNPSQQTIPKNGSRLFYWLSLPLKIRRLVSANHWNKVHSTMPPVNMPHRTPPPPKPPPSSSSKGKPEPPLGRMVSFLYGGPVGFIRLTLKIAAAAYLIDLLVKGYQDRKLVQTDNDDNRTESSD